MIRYRWSVASKTKDNPLPFTKEAVDALFNSSKGITRSICHIADVALLAAFNQDIKEINSDLTKLVIRSLATKEEREAKK